MNRLQRNRIFFETDDLSNLIVKLNFKWEPILNYKRERCLIVDADMRLYDDVTPIIYRDILLNNNEKQIVWFGESKSVFKYKHDTRIRLAGEYENRSIELIASKVYTEVIYGIENIDFNKESERVRVVNLLDAIHHFYSNSY